MNDIYSHSLCHWGVPKMKWGVRRYQNPDGTLTEAGKIRYRKAGVRTDEHGNKVVRYEPKRVEEMTTEELREAVNRIELERKLSSFNEQEKQKGYRAYKQAQGYLNTTVNMGQDAVKAYNVYVGLLNASGKNDKNLQYININPGKKKKGGGGND